MNSQIEHSLLIDGAAAAARPDEQAIQDWGAEQRVFVSSVIVEYGEYRQAAVAAIEALGAEPVWFEQFGGRDSDPNEAYLAEARSSTIYVGLLGARYGRPLADRYSATHQEYREAERSGLRTSVWAQTDADREGPQQSFYEEVRAFEVTGGYTTPAVLQAGLEKRLREIAAQDLSPWVKLGGLVFRATEIEERGPTVTVRANVRDDSVTAALRGLTEGYGRRSMLFSYTDRTLMVEVGSINAVTRAGRAVNFEIELKASAVGQPTRMSYNGASWTEMTQLALRVSLFGEENPLGHHAPHGQPAEPVPRAQGGRSRRGGVAADRTPPTQRDPRRRARRPADHRLPARTRRRWAAQAQACVAGARALQQSSSSAADRDRGRRPDVAGPGYAAGSTLYSPVAHGSTKSTLALTAASSGPITRTNRCTRAQPSRNRRVGSRLLDRPDPLKRSVQPV